jgi:deazaflavin-dependent oxidoreductase (nitroreductase family)
MPGRARGHRGSSPANSHAGRLARQPEQDTCPTRHRYSRIVIDRSLFGQEHVRRYRETDGEVGYIWNGVPTLLLTTTGRRTGEPTTTPLIFGRDGDDYVIVASQGGAPEHPGWYRNLAKEPEVELQVKGDRSRGRARTAEGDERERLWRQMAEIWPHYDEYATRTDREIPVVVVEPR